MCYPGQAPQLSQLQIARHPQGRLDPSGGCQGPLRRLSGPLMRLPSNTQRYNSTNTSGACAQCNHQQDRRHADAPQRLQLAVPRRRHRCLQPMSKQCAAAPALPARTAGAGCAVVVKCQQQELSLSHKVSTLENGQCVLLQHCLVGQSSPAIIAQCAAQAARAAKKGCTTHQKGSCSGGCAPVAPAVNIDMWKEAAHSRVCRWGLRASLWAAQWWVGWADPEASMPQQGVGTCCRASRLDAMKTAAL